jgi:hypothetical protein
MKTKVFMLMTLLSAVYSSGQEQNSQTIIGEWLHIGRDDDKLVIIIFTDNQMAMRNLQYDFPDMTIGYTINSGTIAADDGSLLNYNLVDNDTLSLEFTDEIKLTFKRLYQDISLNGIFYHERDDGTLNDTIYIEFADGQLGRMSFFFGIIVPFEYEIHGMYLTMKTAENSLRNIFVIKSDNTIEDHEGIIFRKKQ